MVIQKNKKENKNIKRIQVQLNYSTQKIFHKKMKIYGLLGCDVSHIFQKRMVQKHENVRKYINSSRNNIYNGNILYVKDKRNIDRTYMRHTIDGPFIHIIYISIKKFIVN